MTIPVLTAVLGPGEADLVTGLARPGAPLHVVRRCADLAELLAAAAAGLARAVLVSAELERLDRETVAQLRASGVVVVVLAGGTRPGADRRLHRLGADQVLEGVVNAGTVTPVVVAAVEAWDLAPGGPPPRSDRAGPSGQGPDGSGPAGPADGSGPRGPADGSGPRGPADGSGPRGPAAGGLAPAVAPRPLPSLPTVVGAPVDTGAPGRPAAVTEPIFGRPPPGGPPAPPAVSGPERPDDGGVVPPRDRVGRLVAVWGPAGAPGRTTVALTLAAELALSGSAPVLVVDADTYGASIAQTLGLLDESAGLAAAARAANQGTLDLDRLARLAPVVWRQLRVLTGLPRPARWPELRPSALEVVWEQARALAAWTVVDCGFCFEAEEDLLLDVAAPRRNGATLSALAEADVVVAVGSADPVGLQRLVRGMQDVGPLLPPTTLVRPVVNRVRASAVGSPPEKRVRDALERYASVRDAFLVPDDRDSCDAALLAGLTLTEHAPRSPARRALAGLAAELVTADAVAGV